MATTPNLGLPLIDGAMTADVPRDMNALANAVDSAVEDAIGSVNIPDASLTVKGKVQLSSRTDGTSESVAATEKAVKDAYDRGSAGVSAAQTAQSVINNRDGYGTTTNSGNVYAVTLAPTPAAYVDGLRITIKINATNTGAVTINVNGLGAKSVLKSNGSAMTSSALRANSVYSLVYNGTSFILQGEGGEYGTAVAADVLTGKTIGTDSGIVSGTMANQGAANLTITSYGQSLAIPMGFHNGSGSVSATYLPRRKFDSIYPGTNPGGSSVSVNIGFAAEIVELRNDANAIMTLVKLGSGWTAIGGGNYMTAPTNFNGTTFTWLIYLDGGNYRAQAWA